MPVADHIHFELAMPGPEDMFWRAAAAVARGRGAVTETRVDVDDHLDRQMFGPDPLDRMRSRRTYRVRVEMIVDDLDYTTASAVQLSDIVQRHLPPEPSARSVLDVIRVLAPNHVAAGIPREITVRYDSGDVLTIRPSIDIDGSSPPVRPEGPGPVRAAIPPPPPVRPEGPGPTRPLVPPPPPPGDVHDTFCNADRRRPRTPGSMGCSCSSVPGSGMRSDPQTPGPTSPENPTPPKPEEPSKESKDDSMTRFSLLELT